MIVVSTAGGNTGQLTALIRAAVKSDQPLPPNEPGNARLRDAIAAATRPRAPNPTPALPATAAAFSGRVYQFPINPSRIDSLALTFAKDGTATVELAYYGDPLRIPIGLDGVYRIGPHGPFGLPAGATGAWRSETEFLLDVNFIANINHYTLAIRFLPDRTIEVTADEASGLIRNGKLAGTPR